MNDADVDSMLLLGALENLLGKGKHKAKGNYGFACPFCNHYKKDKLEVNLNPESQYFGRWQCWVCGEKGRTIKSLLRHMKVSSEEAYQVLQFTEDSASHYDKTKQNLTKTIVRLPDEFQSIWTAEPNSVEALRVRRYLYARGLTDNDFIKYGIGYCVTGKYADRVIIPSYSENNMLNYFVGRSLNPEAYMKYLNPVAPKDDIICFENFIDWSKPVIVCEGMFDAMAIKRNCTCLLGKRMSGALVRKLIENPVDSIYLVLDRDAKKTAISVCQTLLELGKKVYFVVPPKKDPSDTGFELMTKTLQYAEELTLKKLVELKINI